MEIKPWNPLGGAQWNLWLWGPNLWPWLPVRWVGRCTLGFTFAHGSIKPILQQNPVNLPYIWTTDIMIKVEALTNFTKQALLDSAKAIQALKEQI